MPKASLFTIPRLTLEQKRLVRLASTRKSGPRSLEAKLAEALAAQAELDAKITKLTALSQRRLRLNELRDSGLSLSEYLKSQQAEKLTLPTEKFESKSTTEKFGTEKSGTEL